MAEPGATADKDLLSETSGRSIADGTKNGFAASAELLLLRGTSGSGGGCAGVAGRSVICSGRTFIESNCFNTSLAVKAREKRHLIPFNPSFLP